MKKLQCFMHCSKMGNKTQKRGAKFVLCQELKATEQTICGMHGSSLVST